MKPKLTAKIVIDILMTLAMLFIMGYQLWGGCCSRMGGCRNVFAFYRTSCTQF